ncbi:PREDICTED: transmembrane protein 138 [Nicrophorus vespilloides]|uniref:Transmembrane protein 138 n=1 Tax=Nicrophorus vespilloides TaxID=110193 RepID=A0ABM1N208_NICVS|nr:PREDICTED: transmembrane protein 138 [Nicrophorus vespilloides]
MKINPKRFKLIFAIQVVLILFDVLINTFSISYKKYHSILLIFFIVQDACLILALSLLLLSFFSTYVFQAGLVELLYDKFRLTIYICIFYFILTTVLYIWILCTETEPNLDAYWSAPFLTFFILQRLVSPTYYYFYKRAAMKICDPRFYEGMDWDHNQSNQ